MTTSNPGERLGLLGRKVGMMRIFTDDGDAIPVTVLDVSNNRVTQIKTAEADGYSALQVAFGERKASRVSKPEAGHLAKAGVEAGELLKEFRVPADVAAELPAGRADPRRRLRGRPARRRAGHFDRQGLHRHDQASQLQLAARLARQQPFAQRAGLDLDGAGPGSRLPGQEDVGPARQRARRRRRTSTSCASTKGASCCWCAARSPARRTAMSSCGRPSRRRRR